MKIALMQEFSQAGKNPVVLEQLRAATAPLGHTVFNVGMDGDDDHRLTYIHLGIMAGLLLNSRSVDFVVAGCGTGQGALMSLNAWPGVTCGYCIEPTDAWLFAQVNNGNALALAFAKGYGWGAELNVRYIFEKAFGGERGLGYPPERRESQNANAAILDEVKAAAGKPFLDGLRALDPDLLKQAVGGERFQQVLFEHGRDAEIRAFIETIIRR